MSNPLQIAAEKRKEKGTGNGAVVHIRIAAVGLTWNDVCYLLCAIQAG